ncbi:MAG: sigma-70 family RNA polymerase sigma factor [Myxococcota bacterium]
MSPTRRDDADRRDRAWIARIAAGDEAAHRALFDAWYARVLSFVARRLGDPSLAEEVAADVFFEVWRSAGRFEGRSRASSWLFGIAQFKCMAADRNRKRSKRSAVVPTRIEHLHAMPDDAELEEVLAMRHELRRTRALLDELPRGQREVLELAFFDELPYDAIAERLGISQGTVKSRIARARDHLRGGLDRKAG